MATELQAPADTQAEAKAARDAWIDAQVASFAADPSMRDRALASILYDSLMLGQTVAEMVGIMRKEGMGGLVKIAMGAIKNGR